MHTVSYSAVKQAPSNIRSERLGSIDIVRGLAMIFMLLNHATWHVPEISFRVNFGWDTPYPLLPALNPYIWVGLLQGTPLFFVMTGFGVALFEQGRRRVGWTEWQITRYLLIRGAVLIAIDWLILPLQFYPEPAYDLNAYQVLTSIGLCVWAVAFIRLLPMRYILIIALGVSAVAQVIYRTVGIPIDVDMLRSIFLYMSPFDPINFGFPVVPWLGVILLGYLTMRYVHAKPQHFALLTLSISLVAWCLWLIMAGVNQFASLFPSHPLLMTKHPPSLAYLAFYLGATYLLLYLLQTRKSLQKRFPLKQIAVLGQTAFFFYIVHFYVIDIFSALLQNVEIAPIWAVLIIVALSLPLLYVISSRYRTIRKSRPDSVLKYL